AGPLTWGEAYNVHPFDNRIVVLHITGADVRRSLEHALSREQPSAHISGLSVRYDPAAPAGSRVRAVTLDDGSPLRDEVVYTLAVNDFLAQGEGDGYASLGNAHERMPLEVSDLDALIAYLAALPQPVAAPAGARFIPIDDTSDQGEQR